MIFYPKDDENFRGSDSVDPYDRIASFSELFCTRFYNTNMLRISHIKIVETSSAIDIAPSSLESDLAWVKNRGVEVERVFLESISSDITRNIDQMPRVFIDGNMALSGRYPAREEMGIWMMFGFVTSHEKNAGDIRCCTL
jgi:hypothetical protein